MYTACSTALAVSVSSNGVVVYLARELFGLTNYLPTAALISPEDLYKSSCQFDTLHLPIRLKRYDSGLLVLQSQNLSDDRVVQRIVNHVKNYGPITAMKIAELESLALPVAMEQLYVSSNIHMALCVTDQYLIYFQTDDGS
jgi:ESCRT-II complex subunit VPS36